MDPRIDLQCFLREKVAAFEGHLRAWLSERVQLEAPATYIAVREAMSRDVAVLWHPALTPDALEVPTCLVRCDVLDELLGTPALLAGDHTVCGPPHCPTHLFGCVRVGDRWECPRKTCAHGMSSAEWTLAQWPRQTHYRVVQAKYTQLELLQDGRSLGNSVAMNVHRLRLLRFNAALGVLQGVQPPVAYLLGRRTKCRGAVELSCLARAAEVYHHATLPASREQEQQQEQLPAPRTDLPTALDLALPAWAAAPVEYVVDFETVSNLDDDFAHFPRSTGCPMLFMIGCARLEHGEWAGFRHYTVTSLTPDEEQRIISAWLDSLVPGAPVLHWARAEQVMYAAARERHPTAAWPATLPWRDAMTLYRELPLGLPNLKLKHVCSALAPVLETTWATGGPSNGEGAMVAAWWCHQHAKDFATHPLMVAVAQYNWTDCRTVFELVRWARQLLSS
jgi:hypothetical protein